MSQAAKTLNIPFIEGDGIGPEIWDVTKNIIDAAVKIAYDNERSINWINVPAGNSAFINTGDPLPKSSLDILKKYKVSIKGPLTTPVGGGFRSINVQIRQKLDLYACVRPMKYAEGVDSPLKNPSDIDMVIFRENTEDLYAGIEFDVNTAETKFLVDTIQNTFKQSNIRFPNSSAIGIKLISQEGSERLVKSAIQYAIENELPSVTIVHKGNIMKFTEGGFKNWGYATAKTFFPDETYTWADFNEVKQLKGETAAKEFLQNNAANGKVLMQDRIADAFFQDILLHPKNHSVIAATNLNGDYISDSVAGCIGGIGISPGANINYETGCAVFEATHGSAPDIAGKDIANPLSLIFSGVMMLRYVNWNEAADLIENVALNLILKGKVTADLLEDKSKGLTCSEFGSTFVKEMNSFQLSGLVTKN